MINDYNSLSGLQKVAVLFSVVGEGLALSLIKGLSKTEIRKIRSTLQTMGTIFPKIGSVSFHLAAKFSLDKPAKDLVGVFLQLENWIASLQRRVSLPEIELPKHLPLKVG